MRKMMLLAGSIIPVCSSGSIGHGGSGRGTIAALSSGGGLHSGAPPEALLKQLEEMGFRHVPELLRSGHR
jgi:hypothetical protein